MPYTKPEVIESEIQITVKVSAVRYSRGGLGDVTATYDGDPIELTPGDYEAAEVALKEEQPMARCEPDLCEQMGVGLTVGVGTR